MNFNQRKKTAVNQLFARFKSHNVPKQVIADVIDLGMQAGLTFEQAIVGARFQISKHYNFHEYFSVQDVMTATGMSEDEVNEAREKAEAEIIARGENPLAYFPRVSLAPGLIK